MRYPKTNIQQSKITSQWQCQTKTQNQFQLSLTKFSRPKTKQQMSGKTSDADSGAGGKTNSETSNEGKSYIGNFLYSIHSYLIVL
mgnify:CR=1 FL=1